MMTTAIGTVSAERHRPGTGPSQHHRDADNTRLLLLAAARRRFAGDGYVATTVRDIASDAGVNVALINRYFSSKEGLFEACLANAVDELGRAVTDDITLDQVQRMMIEQIAGSPTGDDQLRLLLLLRSSGDTGADQIRRDVFRSFAERVATAAGWRPNEPDTSQLVLRAEIALSATLGIVLVRSSIGLEPLASADVPELAAPFGDLLSALLAPG
jgi:AcrR family transcriptional regulator